MDAPHAVDLVRLAIRAHDRERASSVAATSELVARRNPSSAVHLASAQHAGGLLEGDAGMVIAAADIFRDTQRVLAWASASEDAGRMLLARAEVAKAKEHLDQAHRLYAEAGALRGEMRVRQRLRDLGVRRPMPTGSRRPADVGLPSLTPAELRVVRLVAEGRTNKEIAEILYLSPYTVNTHLKHVFQKLGVSTRTQLAHLALSAGASTGA
jgi:DNA-binding CsgD family transcriptional regulator